MFTQASIQLSSPVLKLDIPNDKSIYALTMHNSVSVLKLFNGTEARPQLILTHNDAVRRASVSQYTLNENFLLVSDKGMNFVGLQKLATESSRLHKVFTIQLDSIVSKIGPGEFKPIWVEDEDEDGDMAMPDESRRVIEEPPKTRVLGTGYGGTVYAFKMLNSMESIDISNRLTQSEGKNLQPQSDRLYPGILWRQTPTRHSSNVIDGDDILARYDKEAWVRDLLDSTSLSTAR